ncbi:MAG: glycosyltransferase family 1 protein [Gammaproteobacteria bacterium]|nr:MAG: glycosyltransferase family 1 protein [Gammaproteobacteria bacterium]
MAGTDRTPRVLHTEWSDGWGGQEIRIHGEMLALRERGVEVMLACRPHARLGERARAAGIPVYHFPFRGNADLSTLWGLFHLIRSQRIDIVNTHSGKDTWVGGLAAKLAGAAFIRTRHLSNPIRSSRLNFINELADFVMTTGESVREAMIRDNRIQPDRIASVPTGIDPVRFDPARWPREECRKALGLAPEEFAVGIVAVLRSFKRHDLLLQAFAELAGKHPELRLVIAGEGPMRTDIERRIAGMGLADRVLLAGHVEEPERVLAALDLFVLSSDSKEGVPQSVMQALLMGLPVVATDAGSTRDLYRGDNMLMVPAGDGPALREAMRRMIEDDCLRQRLAQAARASALKTCTTDVMVERILAIYARVMGGSGPSR